MYCMAPSAYTCSQMSSEAQAAYFPTPFRLHLHLHVMLLLRSTLLRRFFVDFTVSTYRQPRLDHKSIAPTGKCHLVLL
jgi:hypothetical protein